MKKQMNINVLVPINVEVEISEEEIRLCSLRNVEFREVMQNVLDAILSETDVEAKLVSTVAIKFENGAQSLVEGILGQEEI